MDNIIYLLSVLTAAVWSFCFVLIETSASIHIFLVLAFMGIMVSLYMEKRNEISNQ
jgi:hypothetical protein